MIKNLRDFKNAKERRAALEKELKISLDNISKFTFLEEQALGKNIENLIGTVQIPLGVAGPVLIKGQGSRVKGQGFFIPLATTEGALVASVSRGCKAIFESGGAQTLIEEVGITRGPVFKTDGIFHSKKIKDWTEKNFKDIAKVCEQTSTHLKLLKLETSFTGKNLFLRFSFNTSDAMGMNMATIATEKGVQLIERETGAKCISIAGNFDIDKKPAWLNFISGRGKKAWAEVIINREVCKTILKVTPLEIADLVYRKVQIGSAMAGSIGFNAHFANIIAAIFASTGQDLAQVVEGSLGMTTAEVLENGDLYFSIYLPSLIIGTIGGGTTLPAQSEALQILGVKGAKNVLKFACVVAASVLAGELSLIASQAEGSLAKAHISLGRKEGLSVKGQG